VSLFGHMSDKDLFAQLYRDALSKRLLNKKSKCNDAERLVITRMKAEVGQF
jgi:Cullin family